MTTDRLYFTDAYLQRFEARIMERRTRAEKHEVRLDRTAFYPEGGGQPADQGTLGNIPVLDVQSDDGEIWHTVATVPLGDHVVGEVDWERRFDHMQQHHGQHLLSAAFEHLFARPTLSFHLGVEYSSIDLPGTVTAQQATVAEDLVNSVIWENRPIEIRVLSGEELSAVPLRKPPKVAGPVRVVSVPEFDHSACGGTHPHRTGAVGVLHVRRLDRRGTDTRIEFLCGGRALRDLRAKSGILTRLSSRMTVAMEEIEDAVSRLRDRESESRKRLGEARERLLAGEGEQLLRTADRIGTTPLVRLERDDLTVDEARTLVRSIGEGGGVAVLGLRGVKTQVLVGRGSSHSIDCARLLSEVLGAHGGRGGGQPAMAQGGVPDPEALSVVLEALDNALRDLL